MLYIDFAKGLIPKTLRLPGDSGFCSSVVLNLGPIVEELTKIWAPLGVLDSGPFYLQE